MSGQSDFSTLTDKIDILIKIQAALAVKDMNTQKDKIIFLYSIGLKPTFIANLLGTTPTTVSVAMAKHKKTLPMKKEESGE